MSGMTRGFTDVKSMLEDRNISTSPHLALGLAYKTVSSAFLCPCFIVPLPARKRLREGFMSLPPFFFFFSFW